MSNITSEFQLQPVDVLARLQNISNSLDLYETDFQFQDDLSTVYQDLFDAHTLYVKPAGYSNFKYVFPYIPEYRPDTQDFVLRWYLNEMQMQEYANLTKTAIVPDRSVVKQIENLSVLQFLQQLADSPTEGAFVSKEHNTRFTDLLKQTFSVRSLKKYGVPKSLTYQVLYSNEDIDVSLPFVLQASAEIVDLDDLIKKNQHKPNSKFSRFLFDEQIQATTDKSSEFGDFLLDNLVDGEVIKFHKLTENGLLRAFKLDVISYSPNLESPDKQRFVEDFADAMRIFDEQAENDTKLLIDVQGNGGGYITLGYRMLHVLRPFMQPRWGNYSIKSSDVNKYVSSYQSDQNPFAGQERFNQHSMEVIKTDDFIKNKNITVNDDIFSGVYSFDLAYDEVVYKEYFEALSAVKTPHQLLSTDNDKIVFITDGLCGSTCACFTLRAQADHAGLFVGVAGDPADNKNIQIASFVGGSVMDTTQTDLLNLEKFGIKKFPSSALHRWAHEQVYDWNFENQNIVLEYKHYPVDVALNVWAERGNDSKTAEISVKAYLSAVGKCFNFMHKEEGCDHGIEHQIFARFCKDGAYQDKCEIVGCDIGFWLQDGKCVAIPEKFTEQDQGGISTTTTIIICSVVGVFAVVVTALVVYFVFFKKRKQSNEEKPVLEEEYI